MKNNSYKLANIDCASCALKIEDRVRKLNGVTSCNLNYIFLRLNVTFNEVIVSDEEIEECIHKALRNVKILQKNNVDFKDEYQEENIFKKILLRKNK